jgi:hypothetical protein
VYLDWFSLVSRSRPGVAVEGSGILLGVEFEVLDEREEVDLSVGRDVVGVVGELVDDEEEVVERNLSVWDLRTRENMMEG